MTTISYTYEITAVDAAAKAMQITYASPGHGILHVGARLPYEGETLDDVVRMFAPVQHWIAESLPVQTVAEGTAGTQIFDDTITPDMLPPATVTKVALARAMRAVTLGDKTLWDAFKEQVSAAPADMQEDWQMIATIPSNCETVPTVLAVLYGDAAATVFAEVFEAATALGC